MKCRKCKAEIPDNSKYCNMCGARVNLARKPKTRGNGMGSVYKQGNSWRAVVTDYYIIDESGKTKRKCKTKSGFKTKKEALEYLPILKQTPSQKRNYLTFAQIYEKWYPTHRAVKSTMNCYSAAYKYFAPLHNVVLNDIEIDDLQECMDECPKGKRTKENMKALCGLMYKYAVPRHQAEMNLAVYLIPQGGDGGSKNALPPDALPKLEAHLDDVFGAKYVYCHCYLGYRPSEFIMLDVDSYIRAERAFVGGIKTDAGINRTVTISPKIQPFIDELLPETKTQGTVFTDQYGAEFSIKRYRALFYDVLEKCGINNPIVVKDDKNCYTYTPHSCRHTFATLMKRVNGSSKDKQELIGHTSEEMLRYYQDVNFADLRKITDAI